MWICFLIFFCYRGGTWFYGNHSPLGHITLVLFIMSFSEYSEDCPLGIQRLTHPYATQLGFLSWSECACQEKSIVSLSFFLTVFILFFYFLIYTLMSRKNITASETKNKIPFYYSLAYFKKEVCFTTLSYNGWDKRPLQSIQNKDYTDFNKLQVVNFHLSLYFIPICS